MACAALFVAGVLPRDADAAPHWRMDPTERERLRHELRDQAREGRRPPGPGYAPDGPGYGAPPPGRAPGPGYAPPPPGYAPSPPGYAPPPPGYGSGRGHPPMPASPAYAPPRDQDDSGWGRTPHGGPRLSPEEREQLRMQLRERRRLRD